MFNWIIVIGGIIFLWYLRSKKKKGRTRPKAALTKATQPAPVKESPLGEIDMEKFNAAFEKNRHKPAPRVTVSIEVNRDPLTEKIGELHKMASQHKGNNWSVAIESLREAKILVQSRRNDYPIEHHLRLPLFLQQAGDMKGAKAEFDFLLNQSWHPHEEAKIYDKMRLAYQREGDYENAIVYGCMYAAMEFGSDKAREEYMTKHIGPLYRKAQKAK